MNKIINNTKFNHLFGGNFELIDDGFKTGKSNMEFDTIRAKLCSKEEVLPMFRLYGWKTWTVSLGHNQKEKDIDAEKLKEKGFDIVRRPTGGRAVLHADELTYSIVLNLPKNMTAHDVYRELHLLLLNSMKKLGAFNLGFEKVQKNFGQFYQKKPDISVSCFASSARHEIEWQGRKVVGSAQRLFGNTLLQHGSILLGSGHEQLADIIKVTSEEKRNILKNYILSHSATLSEVCKKTITFQQCSESIISAILG